MAWAGRGGALGVDLEAVASFSCAAIQCVVTVPRASIKSDKFSPDSSSDDKRSGGWALFLILVMDAFFVGFISVFSLGTITQNSPMELKIRWCYPARCQQLNGSSREINKWGGKFPVLGKRDII